MKVNSCFKLNIHRYLYYLIGDIERSVLFHVMALCRTITVCFINTWPCTGFSAWRFAVWYMYLHKMHLDILSFWNHWLFTQRCASLYVYYCAWCDILVNLQVELCWFGRYSFCCMWNTQVHYVNHFWHMLYLTPWLCLSVCVYRRAWDNLFRTSGSFILTKTLSWESEKYMGASWGLQIKLSL